MNNLPRHQFNQSDATVLKGHVDVYDVSNDLFYRQQIVFQFRSRFFRSRFVVVFLLESFAVFCPLKCVKLFIYKQVSAETKLALR